MSQYAGVAALTIVSNNYISVARVLCESFLEHHPGAEFFVLLVDILADDIDPEKERFTTISLEEINLPSPDIFPYQYTILELNTAVKPFALKYLLKRNKIKKIAYIDPDILIGKDLDKVWSALNDHSIVLTPHMREPFNDNAFPTEMGILQSGTYNLGFIALKNNSESAKLLDWWIGKLYIDCVVDIPNGLFVDQKWMDLVPAYFEDTFILHDPTYNAAYWNLHERVISERDGAFFVDAQPLSFFHFSGYNPNAKDVLSKHQTRHELSDSEGLKKLFDTYASKLVDAGFLESQKYVYAFGELMNGVKVARSMHKIMRHCLRYHIMFPSPEEDPDAFCEFLMTPNILLYGYPVAPLIHGVLSIREDVKNHYPSAWYRYDEGFMGWLNGTGKEEEDLASILERFGGCLLANNPVEKIFKIYGNRRDLRNAFPDLALNPGSFNKFCSWMVNNGIDEEGLERSFIERFSSARNGFFKVLVLYLMRPDLQDTFPLIHREPEPFFIWLQQNLKDLVHISEDEIYMFCGIADFNHKILERMQLRYNRVLRDKVGSPLTHYSLDEYLDQSSRFLKINDKRLLVDMISNDPDEIFSSALWQLEAFYEASQDLKEKIPQAFSSQSELKRLNNHVSRFSGFKSFLRNRKWMKQLRSEVDSYQPNSKGINLSGYFDTPTGMGQSSRSMLKTAEAAGLSCSIKNLPNSILEPGISYIGDQITSYFGSSIVENRINLIVSNADAIKESINFYPPSDMLDRRNIGYWVWETEELPRKYARAAEKLDEIWTPSEYSASAIKKCVDIPVHVLPHVIDMEEIDEVRGSGIDRVDFGLPNDAMLFGYFFDQKSVLERKNPRGVIRAFRGARDRLRHEEMYLLLKVNAPRSGDLEYEMLKAENEDLNIIWFEKTLPRKKTLELMNCLDAYISLHRSEGFGLTLAEAMALGKPVIASNYSGNVDFMDNECAMLVDTPTIKTKRPYGPYPRGTVWGEPDALKAADAILALLEHKRFQKIGESAREQIKIKLSPKVVAEKMVGLLG